MKFNPSALKSALFISLIAIIFLLWVFDSKKTSDSFNNLLTIPLKKVDLYIRDSNTGEVKLVGSSSDADFLNALSVCLKSSKEVFSFRDDFIKERYIAKFFNDTSVHEIQIMLYENGNSALGGYYKVTDIYSGQSENVGNFGRQSNCLMKQISKI